MSILDIIAKPVSDTIKETKQTLLDAISTPIFSSSTSKTQTTTPQTSGGMTSSQFIKDIFSGADNTTGGIARNTITGIPKATIDVTKNLAKSVYNQIVHPDETQKQYESNYLPYASDSSPVLKKLTAPGVAAARIITRVINPGLLPLANDIAEIAAVNEKGGIADKVAEGKIPSTIFDELAVLKKNVPQIVGDVSQAVLTAYASGSAEKSLVSNTEKSLSSVLASEFGGGLKIGTAFGTAQALSSGSKNPLEIASTIGTAGLAGGVINAIIGGAIPVSKTILEKVKQAKLEYDALTPQQKQQGFVKIPGSENQVSKDSTVPETTSATTIGQKLAGAISETKPLTEEVSSLQSIERAKRFQAAEQAQNVVGGEKGYYAALSELKGKLIEKTPSYTPLKNVLNQAERDSAFNAIYNSPIHSFGEKLSMNDAMLRLLDGQTLQPKQISLLEDVFGKDIAEALMKRRPLKEKILNTAVDIINLPRSLKTMLDASAPFRQGIIFVASHPVISSKAFKGMFADMFSEKSFVNYLDTLYKSPEYPQMRQSGLYIADPRKVSMGIEGREEQFMSNLLEKIPYLGAPARASSRAYSSYLNRVRVDVFNSLVSSFKETGFSSQKVLKELADYVNTATGRGSLGALGRSTKILSALFFSPKFMASRIALLNPKFYADLPKPVRIQAIKDMAIFTGSVITILGLAKLAGASVETDPRSSDFGKIKIGNTRYDITGGFQPWIRFFAQMILGERKSTTTGQVTSLTSGQFGAPTRLDILVSFIRGKLAPLTGTIIDLLAGSNVVGEKVTPKSVILSNTIPLYMQDIVDAVKDKGLTGLFEVGVPSFFGVGTQTYKDTRSELQKLKDKYSPKINSTRMLELQKKYGGTTAIPEAVKRLQDKYGKF